MHEAPPIDILVVDDNPDNLVALEAVLAPLGQRISKASSGKDALRLLLRHEFAVILLDVRMPILDGFETAELLRTSPRCERTPIIFITAHGDDEHLARGYRLGAVDYILTPVVPEVLRAKVGVFVELFRKTEVVRRQSEALGRRADRLLRLTQTALTLNSARSVAGVVDVVARELPALVDAVAVRAEVNLPGNRRHRASAADRAEDAPGKDASPETSGVTMFPILSREGTGIGVIEILQGTSWAAEDDAVAVQLAQMATVAVQNLLYEEEWESNRLKEEFLATLSHELRTPLNAILTWVTLLRQGGLDTDAARRGVDVIERNARAQAKLIEDLLDMSRIISGKMCLNVARLDARSIVTGALESVRPAADARGVQLLVELPDEPVPVTADAERLQQVVWNLLTNAIKFTPKDGHVRVRFATADGDLEISVTDTGSGISPLFLPHVFDRFRQAESSTTRTHRGLGLGLAIVRNLVELHGGNVSADSAGEGLGATFRVRIPRTPPATLAPEPSPSIAGESRTPPAGPRRDHRSLADLRVLVVEDERDGREAMALLIAALGARVRTADSAGDALRMIEEWLPDVVVSDIGLPGEDGFALLARIQEVERLRRVTIPAVALTAYARPQERARALAAGFRAHLAKPVDDGALRETLAAFLPAASRVPDHLTPASPTTA